MLMAPPSQTRDGTTKAMTIPEPSTDGFSEQLVGLDMLRIDPPFEDQVFMELLAVLPGSIPPRGDGSLVEAEFGDDGLRWTAVAQQGENHRDDVRGNLESVKWGVVGGGECPTAQVTHQYRRSIWL